jgi:hypothetical protein
MSRLSLPPTPSPGTPTLHIPSPVRTPSPLPLFSTGGGPYTYTGQITRKYAARFNEIKKTRNSVKDVEKAWEKEAQRKGVPLANLMRGLDTKHTWEDKPALWVEQLLLQDSIIEEGENESSEATKKINVAPEKRLSIEDEHFVDALTSPMEKPKDWGPESAQMVS